MLTCYRGVGGVARLRELQLVVVFAVGGGRDVGILELFVDGNGVGPAGDWGPAHFAHPPGEFALGHGGLVSAV